MKPYTSLKQQSFKKEKERSINDEEQNVQL